ncbi:hypothetical protein PIB30_047823 [Stylosanthes scabra]|uniref:Uncharacterized protein n=1 Tax=Stylosanthes scabra TaxID=79078 RepID=A0ABU6ZFL4_9FABA|nr:hypothetical protein [Stylosanthes scabra]
MKKVKLTPLVESLEEQNHFISTTTPSSTSAPFLPLTPNPNTSLITQLESNQREHESNKEVEQDGDQIGVKFKNTREELTQKASDGSNVPNEVDLWCDIAGVKKGRIYGLGTESTVIDKRSTCRGSGSQSSEWLR